MSTKQKILEGINKLSEKSVDDLFGIGEGICIKLNDQDCVVISMESLIE
ncbi:MAG: hypothetical protein KAJ93_01005 [Methanosarcinales archaeon]|nr:hypothetical protein [Methanosarcinales archaeon]